MGTVSCGLAACSKALPDIARLSSTLQALKNKGTSPFSQDFSAQKYIVLTGECSTEVTGLQFQMDALGWSNVDTVIPSPGGGNPDADAANDYDVNCADGSFSFWVYDWQLDSYLSAHGVAQGISSYDPSSISVRGSSPFLYTDPLVFHNTNNDGGPATKLALDRNGGNTAYGAKGLCTPLQASLRSDSDHSASAGAGGVSFSLQKNTGSWVNVGQNVYRDPSCTSSVSADGSGLSFAAGAGYQSLYIVPSESNGVSVSYRLASSTAGIQNSSSVAVLYRDGSLETNLRWVDINVSQSMAADVCYPMTLSLMDYSNSWMVMNSNTDDIGFSWSGSAIGTLGSSLEAYDTVGACRARSPSPQNLNGASSIVIGQYASSVTKYVRAPATLAGAERTLVVAPSQASGYVFDSNVRRLYVDGGGAAVASVRIDAPSAVSANDCIRLEMSLQNSNHVTLPANGDQTISLSDAVAGMFYTYSGCYSGPSSSVTISDGQTSVAAYYKPGGTGAKTVTASVTIGAATSTGTKTIEVYPALSISGCEAVLAGGSCTPTVTGSVGSYALEFYGVCSAGLSVSGSSLVATGVFGGCNVQARDGAGRVTYPASVYVLPVLTDSSVTASSTGDNYVTVSDAQQLNATVSGGSGLGKILVYPNTVGQLIVSVDPATPAGAEVVIHYCHALIPATCADMTVTYNP